MPKQQQSSSTMKIFHYESQRRGWLLTIQQYGSLSMEELEEQWESEGDRKPFYLSVEEDIDFDSAEYTPVFERLCALLRTANAEEVLLWGRHICDRLVALVPMFPRCRHLFLPKISTFMPLCRQIKTLSHLESFWVGGYGSGAKDRQDTDEFLALADAMQALPNLKHFQIQNRILTDPWDCLEALTCALVGRSIKVEISRISHFDDGILLPYPLPQEHSQFDSKPSYYRLLNQRLRRRGLELHSILSQLLQENPNLTFQDIQNEVDFGTATPWVEALEAFQDDRQAHQALAFKPVLAQLQAGDRTPVMASSRRKSLTTISVSTSSTTSSKSSRTGTSSTPRMEPTSSIITRKPTVVNPASPTKQQRPDVVPSKLSSSSSSNHSSSTTKKGVMGSGSNREHVLRQALEASQQQVEAAKLNYQNAQEEIEQDQALLKRQEARMKSASYSNRRPDRDAAWHALKQQVRASQLEAEKALEELHTCQASHDKLVQLASKPSWGLVQEMSYGQPSYYGSTNSNTAPTRRPTSAV